MVAIQTTELIDKAAAEAFIQLAKTVDKFDASPSLPMRSHTSFISRDTIAALCTPQPCCTISAK
jgi:hypothetical protein